MVYLTADTSQDAQSSLLAFSDLAEARPEFVDEALGVIARRFKEPKEVLQQRMAEQYAIFTPCPSWDKDPASNVRGQAEPRTSTGIGTPPCNGPPGGTNAELTGTEHTPRS